jgi:putative endonuclease
VVVRSSTLPSGRLGEVGHMNFYYVFISLNKNLNFYIGCTSDLQKRMANHNSAHVLSTKYKLPIKLIYYEACISKFDAYKREKYLKSGPGHRYLNNRLKYYLKG